MNLFDLPRTEEDAIKFLQERGILPSKRICWNGHEMKLSVASQVMWQCSKAECKGKAGSRVNMRVGNWLANSKLSYVSIVRFVYCWAHEYTSINFDKQELGMNKNTTVDWSRYMQEMCVGYLKQRGTERDFMDTYLAEFTVREEMKADGVEPFDFILEKIVAYWPPEEQL